MSGETLPELDAAREGQRAFLNGQKEKDNPYPFGKGTWHLRAAWFRGWKEAQMLEHPIRWE